VARCGCCHPVCRTRTLGIDKEIAKILKIAPRA
jgi:hypothetical protein